MELRVAVFIVDAAANTFFLTAPHWAAGTDRCRAAAAQNGAASKNVVTAVTTLKIAVMELR